MTNSLHPTRLALLEDKLRDPGSVANIDCLLDTVTALVADCDHDNVKRIKTIEAYTSRCKEENKIKCTAYPDWKSIY